MLFGQNDGDVLNGSAGDDLLCGGLGDDTRSGGSNDQLLGGERERRLTGGPGADSFSGGPGTDINTDFNAAQADTTDAPKQRPVGRPRAAPTPTSPCSLARVTDTLPLTCAERGRESRDDENAADDWRADLDLNDDLPVSCPECAAREFGARVARDGHGRMACR